MGMPTIADRMAKAGTETAFEVLVRAKALEAQGHHIIHLQIGEPDFATPRNIIEAAKRALDAGHTHYCPPSGIPILREAIAEQVSRTRGIQVNPDQVAVTPGGKPIVLFSLLACVNPGDEVIYPNPGFPIYESVINIFGAKPVPLPLREENAFRVDLDELKSLVSKKTRMLILNSAHNPTGGILTKQDLEKVAEIVSPYDFMILSDEIYSRITYDAPHVSIASVPGMQERTIILDGFSKTFSMTGWRLGYGVMSEKLLPHINRLIINANSCTSTFSQYAGVEALRGPQDEVRKMVEEFRRRRHVIVEGLNKIPGFHCLTPQGAFYVFPKITGTGMTSKALADLLLEKAGVACLSGTDFGVYGEGFIRFSYANSVENIEIALERIAEAVEKLTPEYVK
jgi:aspartate/methionine/tyrosine aminotransferase